MRRRRPPASELAWSFFKASGPGGQHRNKTETGVRLTHLPTGVTVSATERRSRERNRIMALERLMERLALLNRPPRKPRKPTAPGQAARKRRLEAKLRRGRVKALRQKPPASGE
ncbi:peptide chain release factor I [Desulfocarbo indianensis]|nr:peptide chain release factor I [Desulfocarbo indianensis]